MHESPKFLSAKEAADLLGIKLRTLYAYVSRGQIQSEAGTKGRARRYRRADVERLRQRRDARSGLGAVAASALRWGEPVLDSSITQVTESGPLYRGHNAIELAAADTPFESVAELLWDRGLPAETPMWHAEGLGAPLAKLAGLTPADAPPLTRLATLVPAIAARDPGRFDRRPDAVLPRVRRLILRLAAGLAIGGSKSSVEAALEAKSVARAVALALGLKPRAATMRAINSALVLWADHELNVSSFAARVVASSNADVYSCVSAGLAALSGPRHGAFSDKVEALVTEAGKPERAERVLHDRARRGEEVPGFGHPLYPKGDPRAIPLLALAAELAPKNQRVRTTLALVEAQRAEYGLEPTIDVGMVALTAALKLEPGTAPGLIAVGRCAGWVAHVLEQYEAAFLIRPRARYLGDVPVTGA